jgi:hypothetical protein
MLNIRPELKTVIFFIVYFIIATISEKVSPSGVCTPGPGAALLILSVPISIIYALILLFRYYKSQNKQYLNSIYIIAGMWVLFFLILCF